MSEWLCEFSRLELPLYRHPPFYILHLLVRERFTLSVLIPGPQIRRFQYDDEASKDEPARKARTANIAVAYQARLTLQVTRSDSRIVRHGSAWPLVHKS